MSDTDNSCQRLMKEQNITRRRIFLHKNSIPSPEWNSPWGGCRLRGGETKFGGI